MDGEWEPAQISKYLSVCRLCATSERCDACFGHVLSQVD